MVTDGNETNRGTLPLVTVSAAESFYEKVGLRKKIVLRKEDCRRNKGRGNGLTMDQRDFSGLGRFHRFRFSHRFFRLIPRISAICSSE